MYCCPLFFTFTLFAVNLYRCCRCCFVPALDRIWNRTQLRWEHIWDMLIHMQSWWLWAGTWAAKAKKTIHKWMFGYFPMIEFSGFSVWKEFCLGRSCETSVCWKFDIKCKMIAFWLLESFSNRFQWSVQPLCRKWCFCKVPRWKCGVGRASTASTIIWCRRCVYDCVRFPESHCFFVCMNMGLMSTSWSTVHTCRARGQGRGHSFGFNFVERPWDPWINCWLGGYLNPMDL